MYTVWYQSGTNILVLVRKISGLSQILQATIPKTITSMLELNLDKYLKGFITSDTLSEDDPWAVVTIYLVIQIGQIFMSTMLFE